MTVLSDDLLHKKCLAHEKTFEDDMSQVQRRSNSNSWELKKKVCFSEKLGRK